jgi:hypothetical protein
MDSTHTGTRGVGEVSKQMIQVKTHMLLLPDGRKRTTYSLIAMLGKGKTRAKRIRALLETELRTILSTEAMKRDSKRNPDA